MGGATSTATAVSHTFDMAGAHSASCMLLPLSCAVFALAIRSLVLLSVLLVCWSQWVMNMLSVVPAVWVETICIQGNVYVHLV